MQHSLQYKSLYSISLLLEKIPFCLIIITLHLQSFASFPNAVEIALKHIKEELPSVREKNSNIPMSVANIVKRSTAKNLKNRYIDAREMNEDLKTCLNEERLDEEEFIFEFEEIEEEE